MTINTDTPNGGASFSKTVSYTVAFTEDVSYFDGDDIIISGTSSDGSSALSNFDGSGDRYTFDVTTTSDGTLTVSIPKNVAVGSADTGNVPSATHTITVDTIAPTATITADVADDDTVDTNIISYTAFFDETVTGFDDTDDILVSGTAVASASAPTGDGNTYSFTVTTLTDGTLTVSIPENAVTDNAGNGNVASDPYTVTVDAPVTFGTFVSTFGSGGTGNYQFENPVGITTNSTHILVADTDNNRIQVFHMNGTYANTIDSFGDTGNDQFNRPQAVTTNSTHILVADSNNNRIQVFDNTGAHVSTIANQGSRDDRFNSPRGITTNSTHILVVDYRNDRIRVFDNTGAHVNTFGGHGTTDGRFDRPQAITTNSTHILVTDSKNDRIQVFDNTGTHVSTFGRTGSDLYDIDNPRGITITPTHILVTDTNNHRIQVFDLNGVYAGIFGSKGSGNGQFNIPHGITTNSTHILVADFANHRIQIFDLPPTVTLNTNTHDGGIQISETVSYTATFTKDVSYFDGDDIHISGTASGGSPTVSNFMKITATEYTFDVVATDDGTVTVSIPKNVAVSDSVNGNIPSDPYTVTVNIRAPIITIIADTADGGTAYTKTISYRVTFDMDVNDFTESDIKISGTASGDSPVPSNFMKISPTEYTFDVATVRDGTIIVIIPKNVITNDVGLGNVASDTHTITVDAYMPTATITANTADHGTTGTNMISYTVTFDETVTGFDDADDVTLSGTAAATASPLTGDGTAYFFTVTADSDGTVIVSIPANAAEDSTGNYNIKSDPYTVTVDTPVTFVTFVRTFGMLGSNDDKFNFPTGITTNSTHILVADTSNHRIQVFDLNGNYADTLDPFGSTNDDQFNSPHGITTNSTHILVADTGNHRIQVFDNTGTHVNTIGNRGSGDNGFNSPRAITTNSTHILVADSRNNRIQVFDDAGTHVISFGLEGAGGGSNLNPRGITTNSTHILVTDTNNDRIQVFDSTGTYVGMIGSRGSDDGEFLSPRGITTTSTHIFIADTNNNRIQIFDLGGNHLSTIGSNGSGDGQFAAPYGITTNSTHMLVTDTRNNRIQIFDLAPVSTIKSDTPNGSTLFSDTVSYTVAFTEDVSYFDGDDITISGTASGGSPTVSNFMKITASNYTFDVVTTNDGTVTVSIPKNVAIDSADIGNVASATHTITIDANPAIVTITADTPDDGTAETNTISYTATFDEIVTDFDDADDIIVSGTAVATVSTPTGDGTTYFFTVTTTSDGTVRLFIPADAATDNQGINNAESDPYTVTVDVPVSFGAFVNMFGNSGEDNDLFDNPQGITTNSTHILVADSDNHRIQIFDLNGILINTIGGLGDIDGLFRDPTGITTNSTHILVTDSSNSKIQIFHLNGTHANTINDGHFVEPTGITTNSTHILVIDSYHDHTRVFDHAGTHIDTFDSTDSDHSQFASPYGITTNSTHILIADRINHRIQIFDLNGIPINTIGSSSPHSGIADGEFDFPQGITTTSTHILVTDSENHRIQVFDLDGNHVSSFGSQGTAYGQFDSPNGITTNSTHILVVDTDNDRIQVFDFTPAVTISSTSPDDGSVFFDTISYVVLFSESVTGFDESDITISGTASVDLSAPSNFEGSGDSYTFDVVSTSDGTVTVSVPKNVATDNAGNINQPSAFHTTTINTSMIVVPSDSPRITDTVSLKFFIAHTDTPVLSDTITGVGTIEAFDSPTISDTTSMQLHITTTDTPAISDEYNIRIPGTVIESIITVSDSPILSDSASNRIFITFSDSPAISDVITGMGTIKVSDSPVLSDTASMQLHITVTDTPAMSDESDIQILTTVIESIITVSDSPVLSDSASNRIFITFSDSPAISDVITGMGAIEISDSPVLSDTASMQLHITVTDTPAISDEFDIQITTPIIESTITASDSPILSDNTSLNIVITTTDTPAISDESDLQITTPIIESTITASDSPILSDNTSLNIVITTTDTPAISDESDIQILTTIIESTITASDSPVLSDSVSNRISIILSDSPAISDTISGMGTIEASDSPTITDTVSMQLHITVTDAPGISDESNIEITTPITGSEITEYPITVSDSPILSDTVSTRISITISDSPAISDTISGMGTIEASDSPVLFDTVTINTAIPEIISARLSTNTITIIYNVPVTTILAHYTDLTIDGVSPQLEISDIAGSTTDTISLTLPSMFPAGTVATIDVSGPTSTSDSARMLSPLVDQPVTAEDHVTLVGIDNSIAVTDPASILATVIYSNTVDATLNYSSLLENELGLRTTMTNDEIVITATGLRGGNVQVTIPAATLFSSPTFDGTLVLPTDSEL